MKTLDEVIKRIEIYKNIFDKNGCFECHYHEDDCTDSCFLENVLYYLNTIETTENLYHNAVNELNKWIENDWKDRCLPLTWDELKQMDMQPVWYESLYWGIKTWAIVLVQKESIYLDWYHRCQDGEIIKGDRCEIHKDQQGERWQAYRKKNNGR